MLGIREAVGLVHPLEKTGSEEMVNSIVVIDEDLCTGCGACTAMCPKQILHVGSDTDICQVTDETQCDKLRGCERVCPSGAIKIH